MKPANASLFLLTCTALAAVLLLSSCADTQDVKACVQNSPDGFFAGLWHGWVASLAFIASLFNSDIAIYSVNNNGGWYDFGFVMGIGGFSSTTTKVVTTVARR